jgi:hypothetical protein
MAAACQSVTAPVKYQTFIGRRWLDAADGAMFESEDPFSGEKWHCCRAVARPHRRRRLRTPRLPERCRASQAQHKQAIAQEEIFGPVLGIISFHDDAGGEPVIRFVGDRDRLALHVAVWRLQEQRLRPRTRPAFDRGIFADQECLD